MWCGEDGAWERGAGELVLGVGVELEEWGEEVERGKDGVFWICEAGNRGSGWSSTLGQGLDELELGVVVSA